MCASTSFALQRVALHPMGFDCETGYCVANQLSSSKERIFSQLGLSKEHIFNLTIPLKQVHVPSMCSIPLA